jgi:hypothetical protein
MDTSCPCECLPGNADEPVWENGEVNMIVLDQSPQMFRAFVSSGSSGSDVWGLTPGANGKWEASRSAGEVIATLSYRDETLMLEKNGDTTWFVNYVSLEAHQPSAYIGYLNAFLLENTLADSDTLLRSLFALDSTVLHCTPEMGNVIYAHKLPEHKQWIIQPRGRAIVLYQYLGDENQQPTIQKEDTLFIGKFPRR